MSGLLKMTAQSFASLFSMMKSNDHQLVYIVDPTYQHQYYLTPSYEKIWGRSLEASYQDLSIWYKTVVTEDLERVVTTMNQQQAAGEIPLNNQCYRILQPNNDLKWLSCQSFPLYNEEAQCIAIVGLIESVTQDVYSQLIGNNAVIENGVTHAIADVFGHALKLSAQSPAKPKNQIILPNQTVVTLTRRELECLSCLKEGMSAKETARQLSISQRTVETHIENLKHKLGCKNKYQLIHQWDISNRI